MNKQSTVSAIAVEAVNEQFDAHLDNVRILKAQGGAQ